ncbi:alpha/beta fold hydrolase [Pontibacter rugosus]
MAFSQQLPTGSWAGDLNVRGAAPIKVIFNFPAAAKGQSLVSIPYTGMHDLQVERVKEVGDSLQLAFRDHLSSYTFTALYGAGNKGVAGLFVIGDNRKFPLTISLTNAESLRPSRPQTPTAPFPYAVLPITFAGGDAGVMLSGTITAPKGKKEVPGVILLSGSGPHNRDGEQFYHKTFLVLADELTKRGFAVLRYDERGVGESSGKYAGNFTEDFAPDGLAAVKALQTDKRLKVKNVYVIGHSEGTLMAQIIAAEAPDVAGVVLLAAAGLPGVAFNKSRHRALLKANGISEEQGGQDLMIQDRSYEIVGASPDSATAVANLRKFHEEIDMDPNYSERYITPFVDPWLFHSLHFDPTPYQQKIKVPVLAITGETDSQTPAQDNMPAIKAGLQAAGNANFTPVVLPKLNHFMQTSVTGAYDESYTLEETFSPEVLKMVGDWLVKQATGAGKARRTAKGI